MQALRHAREHHAFLARPRREPAPPHRAVWTPGTQGVLGNAEAMRLLGEFGIPLVRTLAAADAEAAVKTAEGLGWPVALKIDSPDVLHKTDVGGVRLGCGDASAVREAFRDIVAGVGAKAPAARIDGVLVQPMIAGGAEMILGIKHDPLFGPAVVCGFGGILVEVLRDVSIRVPPLSMDDAREMLAELRGAALLRGVRGRPPADVDALAAAVVALAALADAHRGRLRALDLNPLVVRERGHGVVAVDWLIEFS
jgi:acyl-CoA synthetase (NDP forming)